MTLSAQSNVGATPTPASRHDRDAREQQRGSRLRRWSLVLVVGLAPLGLAATPHVVNATTRVATNVVAPELPPVTVTLPTVALPPVTALPRVTVALPSVTVTLPRVTVTVTLPPITTPPVTLPPITTPAVTLPPITTPPVTATLPAVTVTPPQATLPPVTGTLPSPTVTPTSAGSAAVTTLTTAPDSGSDVPINDADPCVEAGLVDDALAQCQDDEGADSAVETELCVAAGLAGDALRQCQADDGGDSVIEIELCAAAGLEGDVLTQCQADDGGGSVIEIDVCVAAGLAGDALAQCQADYGGDPTVDAAVCVAAGLVDDTLAQCQRDDGADSVIEIELCAAAGLAGDALTQCQADDGGDSVIEIDVCAAAGAVGDASTKCAAAVTTTTVPGGATTTVPGGATTTVPGGATTTVPGGATTTVPGGATTTVPGGATTTVPGAQRQPAGGATTTTLGSGDSTIPGDLREGAVFSMSNDPTGNAVVAFYRADDGTLTPAGTFATDGLGSGGFEDSANSLVLGSAKGESAPNNFIDDSALLFATNAGSNDISVFQVNGPGLELVDVEPSNGVKPVSITVHDGIVYVLNNDETDGSDAELNCREGASPSVTGFRLSGGGDLTPIPDSTRVLSGGVDSGCAQVSFNPEGTVLVVSQRTGKLPGQAADDEGTIDTFVVNADGTLGQQQTFDVTGEGPCGFTFNSAGVLVTTEQFDGTAGPALGAAGSYQLGDDGTLTPSTSLVGNGGTDTCWFVINDDGTVGFATSFFADGRISSYAVGADGSLALLQADADPDVDNGASDLSLSGDSRYLYQLNALEGTISAFAVGPDGTLQRVDTEQAHEPSPVAAPLGLAAT